MRPRAIARLLLLLIVLAHHARAVAASLPDDAADPPSTGELLDLGLDDLLRVKVSLPARVEQSEEEAPSIVSVITREDMAVYGARDIADVLRMVPGFEFGIDVFAIVGLGVRGIWGHEGKVLVQVNGITVNELGYGNVNYFGSYPTAMLQRVEIVRGPGSALYGGFAEVAIINMITVPGSELDGISVRAAGGLMGSNLIRTGSVSAGTKTGDLEIASHLSASYGPCSARPFLDFFGGQAGGGNAGSYRHWLNGVLDATYKDALRIRFTHGSLTYLAQDGAGQVADVYSPDPERVNDRQSGLSLRYRATPVARLTVEPSFEYLDSNAIATPVDSNSAQGEFANPRNDLRRYRAEVAFGYGPVESQVTAGVGYARDSVNATSTTGAPGLQVGSELTDYVATDSRFVYTQYLRQVNRTFAVTVGVRYEKTSFGAAVAPRVGLTYVRDNYNAKLLYGRSFRIPLPFQAYSRSLAVNPDGLEPETSDTVELELGRRLGRHAKAKLNLFYIEINQPITYLGDTNSYHNFGRIRSYGAEAELRLRRGSWGGFVNASLQRPGADTSPGLVTADGDHALGLPEMKLNLGVYRRWGELEIGPTATVLGRRYGQSQESAMTGFIGNTSYRPVVLANLALTWRRAIGDDLSLSLSAHNLFNTGYRLVQPYYGGHAPLPAQDRDVRLELRYDY